MVDLLDWILDCGFLGIIFLIAVGSAIYCILMAIAIRIAGQHRRKEDF